MHTPSYTDSNTMYYNTLGDPVPEELDSPFGKRYSELNQEISTAHLNLAVMQKRLDDAVARREALPRTHPNMFASLNTESSPEYNTLLDSASASASVGPASLPGDSYTTLDQEISSAQCNITVLQQHLDAVIARKRNLTACDPKWLGVYPVEGTILHPPYPNRFL